LFIVAAKTSAGTPEGSSTISWTILKHIYQSLNCQIWIRVFSSTVKVNGCSGKFLWSPVILLVWQHFLLLVESIAVSGHCSL
jgi:hypothetical protein